MLFPSFDVVGTWVKPVVAEMTGVSAPAKRKAATPRRDQRAGWNSAPVPSLKCELFTTLSRDCFLFYKAQYGRTGNCQTRQSLERIAPRASPKRAGIGFSIWHGPVSHPR